MSLNIDTHTYAFELQNISAYSLNALFFADKRHGWKTEAREWAAQICHQVNGPDIQPIFEAIRSNFKLHEHVLAAHYEFKTPKLFTNYGTISRFSKDLSNLIKPLEDVLFTETFNGKGTYKCKNLSIDDSYVCELSARKSYAETPSIVVTITILPHPKKPNEHAMPVVQKAAI